MVDIIIKNKQKSLFVCVCVGALPVFIATVFGSKDRGLIANVLQHRLQQGVDTPSSSSSSSTFSHTHTQMSEVLFEFVLVHMPTVLITLKVSILPLSLFRVDGDFQTTPCVRF